MSTILGFIFSVQKLARFSSNPGRVYFEGLVHFLRNVLDNKALGLIFYYKMNDSPLSDLLRQVSINNENQFMVFSYSSRKDCPDTSISTGAYLPFINMGLFTMAHMFQYQFLNQVQK